MMDSGDRIIFWGLLGGKKTSWFLIGVVFSISFSMAVILSTIGIMDGFDETLKKGLKKASGDVILYNSFGFFEFEGNLQSLLEKNSFSNHSPYVQSEGFLILENKSRGVLIRGVDLSSFSSVTKVAFSSDRINQGEVYLSDEIQNSLKVKNGDEIVIAFPKGNEGFSHLPVLKSFKVSGSVGHGVYEKDSRIVYIDKKSMASILGVNGKVNVVSFNLEDHVPGGISSPDYIDHIRNLIFNFPPILDAGFKMRPFWSDYTHLIKAVEIEKLTIIIILQIIVVVAIFNILAFIIYLNEKRSQELFIYQAVGASKRKIRRIWHLVTFVIWVISCIFAYFLTIIFDYALRTLNIFRLPGDVYAVSHLFLKLSYFEYAKVFILALVWILTLSSFVIYQIHKKSVLDGLRKEFA